MILRDLSLRGFRNLGDQDLTVPPDGFALIGDNAQGKSNLLEAVYYLETFRSFRGASDPDLVGFDRPFFRLEARLRAASGDEEVRVAAAYERATKRKKVTVGGQEVDRLGDGIGRLAAIVFSPADIGLVSEGPSERRRFLDILLSLNVPGYLDHLQRYRQALERRNAALRGGAPAEAVAAWDGPLVGHGAAVIDRRLTWVGDYEAAFSEVYEEISGGDAAWISYRSSVALPAAEEAADEERETRLREAFLGTLLETRDRERRRGWTVVGPHRDDLFIGLGKPGKGSELRRFGSGGQRRTAALALRLAEAETIRRTRDTLPMVLMDDVFAELDPGRSERLLAVLEGPGTGQVLLTAPKEADVRLRRETLPRWRIRAGEIET